MTGFAPIVLRGRQHRAALFGRVDDAAAGAYGDAERLLHQGVFAGRQRGGCDLVVAGAVGDDIDGGNVGMGQHSVQIGEDQGRASEQALDLARDPLGILAVDVADGHQLHIRQTGLFQGVVGDCVAMAHAAATDYTDGNAFIALAHGQSLVANFQLLVNPCARGSHQELKTENDKLRTPSTYVVRSHSLWR